MKVRCPECGKLIDVPKSGLIGQLKIKKMKTNSPEFRRIELKILRQNQKGWDKHKNDRFTT